MFLFKLYLFVVIDLLSLLVITLDNVIWIAVSTDVWDIYRSLCFCHTVHTCVCHSVYLSQGTYSRPIWMGFGWFSKKEETVPASRCSVTIVCILKYYIYLSNTQITQRYRDGFDGKRDRRQYIGVLCTFAKYVNERHIWSVVSIFNKVICHVAGIQNTMFLQYINSDEEHSKFKLLRNYYYDIL